MSGYKTNALKSAEGGGFLGLVDITTGLAVPASLTDGTNVFNMGYIKDSAPELSSTNEDLKDETEQVIFNHTKDRKYKTTGNLMQSDPDTINLLAFGVQNKAFLEIKYQGASGGYHKIYFALVNVKEQMKDELPSKQAMPYESNGFVSKSDFTISADNITALKAAFPTIASLLPASPATIVIPANKEFKLYTKAVA